MKKALCLFLLLTFVPIVSSCGVKIDAIDDCEWKMRAVADHHLESSMLPTDPSVIAVGEADEAYPYAKIVNMTLVAENGNVTLNDPTNNKIYSGTYSMLSQTSTGTNYEIAIDGYTFTASVTPAEYSDDGETPTLTISFLLYTVYCIPNK